MGNCDTSTENRLKLFAKKEITKDYGEFPSNFS